MTAPLAPANRPRPALTNVDFDRAPFIVIWEMTQACDLPCLHCRPSAAPRRDPHELTTTEAKRLIDTVRRIAQPLFVLTGGDPLERPGARALDANQHHDLSAQRCRPRAAHCAHGASRHCGLVGVPHRRVRRAVLAHLLRERHEAVA